MLGPGSYFPYVNIYKKDENKKGNNLFKNDGMKKVNIKILYNQMKSNIEKQVGPGSYNLQNYNEWHKKSFNSLYV